MEAKYLKINPADNVAVAITALPAGEKLTVDGKGITLNEDVPAGHKFALKDFAEGENVIKYGYPIGHARKAQKQGDWMNENNIKTNLSGLLEYTYNPVNVDLNTTTLNLNTGAPNLTFRGYKRKNGDVGVRNEIWIIPTVGCVNGIINQLAEGLRRDMAGAEFHELALGEPWAISGAHGDGVRELIEDVLEHFPDASEDEDARQHPKFAVIGRPNVGKSTLVNAILGEERVIAFDQAGTTRDSIYIDFEREAKPYTIIDTAGVRRRGKVDEMIEKFSVIKTLQAIEDANVVVLVLDAQLDVSEQDATLAGFALEAGRALVVAVNKWDGLDDYAKDCVRREIDRKLNFLGFAKFHFISALHGKGVGDLFRSIDQAYQAAMVKLSTPRLTRALDVITERQAPPRNGMSRPKMRYAHQGGVNPPVVVIHGSNLVNIPDSYTRYLEHSLCKLFKLEGTPLRVQYKSTDNPYAERKQVSVHPGRRDPVKPGKQFRKK